MTRSKSNEKEKGFGVGDTWSYLGWVFSGLLTDEGKGNKAPLSKICRTYPAMMISYLAQLYLT